MDSKAVQGQEILESLHVRVKYMHYTDVDF